MTGSIAVIVVMGVSGAGKSYLGAALARRLGREFIDADDLHPAANKAKMAAGVPLDDADRWPWLDVVATTAAAHAPVVVACSALRRAYRDRLRAAVADIAFVELDVAPAELEARLAARRHEFMPASLLTSQLATLEPLGADERGIRLRDGSDAPIEVALDRAEQALAALADAPRPTRDR